MTIIITITIIITVINEILLFHLYSNNNLELKWVQRTLRISFSYKAWNFLNNLSEFSGICEERKDSAID